MFRRLLLGGLALALAGCASAPPRHHRPEGGPPDGAPDGRPRVRLFLSPSGEPFRGPDGLGAWFAGADANHDGAIVRAEFQADAARFFRVLDVNGDGQLDGSEIQAYEHDLVPEITQMGYGAGPQGGGERPQMRGGGGGGGRGGGGHGGGGHGGGGHGGGGGGGGGRGGGGGGGGGGHGGGGAGAGPPLVGREGAARFSLINEPQPVTGADEDLNGRVSLEEWTRATDRRFVRLDTAKTGRLTRETLPPLPGPRPR